MDYLCIFLIAVIILLFVFAICKTASKGEQYDDIQDDEGCTRDYGGDDDADC